MKLLISLMLLFFPTDEIDLKLDLEVGEVYTINSKTEVDISKKVQGMDLEINTVLHSTLHFDIKEHNGDNYKAEMQYEMLTMDMNLPMQQSKTMTTDKDHEAYGNTFSQYLTMLTDEPFEAKINENGKVQEVSGISEAFEVTAHNFDEDLSSQEKMQLQALMEEAYDEETFITSVELITGNLPEQPVALNETWTAQIGNPSFEGEVLNELSISELTDDYILIGSDNKIDLDEKMSPEQMPGAEKASLNMNGSVASSIKLDPETKWVSEAEINQEMEGYISIEEAPDLPDDKEIPTTISISATYFTDP